MGLKLFGGRVQIGSTTKSISPGVAQSDDIYSFMMEKYGVDYSRRNKLEAYKNVVYACISLIAEQCGGYEPKIMKKNGDQWEDIGDHELLTLLNRPGGDATEGESFSQFDLFESTSSYQELVGDAFWYMDLGDLTGKPKEITVLRPDKVGTDVNKETGEIQGYYIRQASGNPIPLEVNEVLRFPLFNPKDPYHGYGRVEAGNDYIATDEATAKFTKNFFFNNAGLTGVLNIKGEVSKGAFRKFVRAWRNKYEGVDNAGKVAIVRDSEAAFTKIGLGLDELNMAELRKMTIDDVLMIFRVPLPLLGKAEQTGLGRANVETLEYIFAKYKIEPIFKRYDAVLQFALERYWGETELKITHENIIPEDKEFELNERDKGVDRWLKRNEVRDEEGLDGVDGGDDLYVPMSNIPIGTDLTTPADDNSDTADTADPAPDPTEEDSKSIRVTLVNRRPAPKSKKKVASANEDFRLKLQRSQLGYEKHYKKALAPIMRKQRKEALNNLEAHASSLTKDFGKLFDDAAYDILMNEALPPVLQDLSEIQGALALVFAGDDESKFKMSADLLSLLRKSTAKMSSNFNDDTLERLNLTLADGVQNGESITKLKERVNEVYDNVDGSRSERIARTETLKASNNATEAAYKQTGYVNAKEWYVNPDACPICEPFDGKTIGLGESFAPLGTSVKYTDASGDEQEYQVSYDDVDNPPLHPNCRCTIVPVR